MKRLFRYVAAVLAVALTLSSPVFAAVTAPAAGTPGSAGLTITPRRNLTIQPGSGVSDKLTIGNLDDTQDLKITFKIVDFTFTDQTGTPKLLLSDNAQPTTWSLKPFLTLPKSVDIPAGETKTINYDVKIPKNQGAGSYYSSIEYAATGANGGNVALSASGATLVFVSVPGTVHEEMDLKKFGAYQNSGDSSTGQFQFIATKKPQQVGFLLKNNGNVAESPKGSITLKPMFGKNVITISDVNPIASLALIGQTRLFLSCIQSVQKNVTFNGNQTPTTQCTDPSLTPGRYTANLDIFYGQNGNQTKEITKTVHFWYLPWWFIAIVVTILVVVGLLVWWIVRKIRGAVNGSNTNYRKRRR